MQAAPKTPRNQAASDAMPSWLSVVRVYNLCAAVLSQRLAPLGLKLAEHEVLANLLRAPGLTQQQLAERCFVAKSGASMLVTRLAGAGYLMREADAVDARVWRLQLTPAGRALAQKAQAIQADVVVAMAEGSSPAEQQGIKTAMDRASATLEKLLRETAR
jgi:DNA-binding MarR family transcriptional regulator